VLSNQFDRGNQDESFRINCELEPGQGYKFRYLQVNYKLKLTEFAKHDMEIDFAASKPDHNAEKHEVHKLPLALEYMKGAQTSDSMQPCQFLNYSDSVFCSNYPQPEFIFKHQHDARFIMTGFTIQSQFNRDSMGMPVGKGYVFASEHLEDIFNTKHFIH
jgi:hypothetical protein